MPHMVDVDIMNELQERFPEEFDKTSSHKLRSPDDMQFALSYFYYLIDQPKEFNMTRIFNEVDIDKSGKRLVFSIIIQPSQFGKILGGKILPPICPCSAAIFLFLNRQFLSKDAPISKRFLTWDMCLRVANSLHSDLER